MPYPSTPSGFANRFTKPLSADSYRCLSLSGSRWGGLHLQILRVLLDSSTQELLILKPYMTRARTLLKKSPDLVGELELFKSHDLSKKTHAQLRQESNRSGAFYQAVATVREIKAADVLERDARPTRSSKQPDTGDFISWDDYESSDTSLSEAMCSSYEPSESVEASLRIQGARAKPEIATSNVALEFLSSVLSLSRSEHHSTCLEFTSVPARFATSIGSWEYISINDGSLVQRGWDNGEWEMVSKDVSCSVEAKATFIAWEGGRVGVSVGAAMFWLVAWVGWRRYKEQSRYKQVRVPDRKQKTSIDLTT